MLPLSCLTSLTNTCSSLFEIVQPIIDENFPFRYTLAHINNIKLTSIYFRITEKEQIYLTKAHPKIVILDLSKYSYPMDKLIYYCFYKAPLFPSISSLILLIPDGLKNFPINTFPRSLTHLSFGYICIRPIQTLPLSLTHLSFGDEFNQPLTYLPRNLTHLAFGKKFSFPIPPSIFPLPLISLKFGIGFTSNVPSLPHLTHLYFPAFSTFNQFLPHSPCLTHLSLGRNYNFYDNLPPTLTYLCFGEYFNSQVDQFPPSLTHLIFGVSYNEPVDHLPDRLTHLSFSDSLDLTKSSNGSFTRPLDCLPPSLICLILGGAYWQPIPELPPHLKYLNIFRENPSRFELFPMELTHLTIYRSPIFNCPHSSLTYLETCYVDNDLPESLTHLFIKYSCNEEVRFPPKLTHLACGRFDNPKMHFPPSISHLLFSSGTVDITSSKITHVYVSGNDKFITEPPASVSVIYWYVNYDGDCCLFYFIVRIYMIECAN